MRNAPSYIGLRSASSAATRAARGSSKKRDTKPELKLRRALWARGLRYRVDVRDLPGRPDIVFVRARVVCFVDGDYWHGRDLDDRIARLALGHNAPYWMAKIRANVERDRRHDAALAEAGWTVVRLWETDVLRNPGQAVQQVEKAIARNALA
jgi:DNA mismatch endonuclease (patch repair protein)